MEQVTELINNNFSIIVAIVAFLLSHFGASITVALTKTKNTKWYKLLELLALVVKEAKKKADEE